MLFHNVAFFYYICNMEKLIDEIEKKIDAYQEVLKHSRQDDEWLKGYVAGLLEAKQVALLLCKTEKNN